jgi:hypothetical protein
MSRKDESAADTHLQSLKPHIIDGVDDGYVFAVFEN